MRCWLAAPFVAGLAMAACKSDRPKRASTENFSVPMASGFDLLSEARLERIVKEFEQPIDLAMVDPDTRTTILFRPIDAKIGIDTSDTEHCALLATEHADLNSNSRISSGPTPMNHPLGPTCRWEMVRGDGKQFVAMILSTGPRRRWIAECAFDPGEAENAKKICDSVTSGFRPISTDPPEPHLLKHDEFTMPIPVGFTESDPDTISKTNTEHDVSAVAAIWRYKSQAVIMVGRAGDVDPSNLESCRSLAEKVTQPDRVKPSAPTWFDLSGKKTCRWEHAIKDLRFVSTVVTTSRGPWLVTCAISTAKPELRAACDEVVRGFTDPK